MKLSFENQHKMREPLVLALGVVLGLFAERLRQRASQRRPPIRAPGFKPWRMSKWVRYNGVVETQGLCGDPKATVAEQTAQALAKLDAILAENALARGALISVSIYIADMATFDEMNKVYDPWLDADSKPTRACVQAQLGGGAAVEIRASAWCDA